MGGSEGVRESLAEIKSLLQKKGIPFVVILNNPNKALKNLFNRASKEEKFYLIQINARKDPRWIGSDIRNYVNSVVDIHPNADGNTILATLIHEALVKAMLINSQ